MYPTIGTGIIRSLFVKSRQAWYESEQRSLHGMLEETFVLKLVEEIQKEMPRIGTQKLKHKLHVNL